MEVPAAVTRSRAANCAGPRSEPTVGWICSRPAKKPRCGSTFLSLQSRLARCETFIVTREGRSTADQGSSGASLFRQPTHPGRQRLIRPVYEAIRPKRSHRDTSPSGKKLAEPFPCLANQMTGIRFCSGLDAKDSGETGSFLYGAQSRVVRHSDLKYLAPTWLA